jgi:hypothetical protein
MLFFPLEASLLEFAEKYFFLLPAIKYLCAPQKFALLVFN